MTSTSVNRPLVYAASYPVPPEVEPFPPFPVEEERPEDGPTTAVGESLENPGYEGQALQSSVCNAPLASTTNAPLRSQAQPAPAWQTGCPAVSFEADVLSQKAEQTAAMPRTGCDITKSGDGTDTVIGIDSAILRAVRLRGSISVASNPSKDTGAPGESQLPSQGAIAQPEPSDSDSEEQTRQPDSIVGTGTGHGIADGATEPKNSPHLKSPAITTVASDSEKHTPLVLYYGQGSPSIWEEATRANKQFREFSFGKK